jgi:hypothetical protein
LEIRRQHSVLETCAIQWRECAQAAVAGLQDVPADQRMTIRFEDLILNPGPTVTAMLEFLRLPPAAEVADYAAAEAKPTALGRWKTADPADVETILRHIHPDRPTPRPTGPEPGERREAGQTR